MPLLTEIPYRRHCSWRSGLIVLLVIVLAGCSTQSRHGSRSKYLAYKVSPGDTLYSIAWRYGYDAREVAAWNGLAQPYTIYPGQKLVIIAPPRKNVRKGPTPAQQMGITAANSSKQVTPAPKPTKKPHSKPPLKTASTGQASQGVTTRKPARAAPSRNRKIVWNWPTQGKILERFDPGSGSKGIDIGGKVGQEVKAAASGKIVYSGKGLIGYGNLIIIKHNETYLSAYGHNSRLLVKEGATVKKGQLIAYMGNSNKGKPLLHFEIRKQGKPINPMWYLPK